MENIENSCKNVKTDQTHNDEEIMAAKILMYMSLGFANRAVDNNASNPFSMPSTSVACSPSESLDPSPGPSSCSRSSSLSISTAPSQYMSLSFANRAVDNTPCDPFSMSSTSVARSSSETLNPSAVPSFHSSSSSPSISPVPSPMTSYSTFAITDIIVPRINTGTQTLTDYTEDYKMSRADKANLMQQFSDLFIRFTEYMNQKYPDRFQKNGQMLYPQNRPVLPSKVPKSRPAHSTSDDGENKSVGSSKMYILGSHGTLIPTSVLREIAKRRLSCTKATRKILEHFFSKETLATHSLTGKVSPAFPGKPPKKALHKETVEDIVEYVSRHYRETIKQVRVVITTKCADEAKLKRFRESMLEEDDDDNYDLDE